MKKTSRQAVLAIYRLIEETAGETRLSARAFAKLEARVEAIANESDDPEEVLEIVGEPLAMTHPL